MCRIGLIEPVRPTVDPFSGAEQNREGDEGEASELLRSFAERLVQACAEAETELREQERLRSARAPVGRTGASGSSSTSTQRKPTPFRERNCRVSAAPGVAARPSR